MDQSLKEKRRRATIVAVSIIGTLATLLIGYKLTLGRPPLIGVDHHDFGTILIGEGEDEGIGEHTFVLTNRTGSTITINQVTASCGCTATRYSPRIVEPGAELHVDVALTTTNNGLAEERVYINTADRGVRTLTVRGVGRREQQLRTNRSNLPLFDKTEQTFAVIGDVWPGDLPEGASEPSLTIDGGQWLDVTLNRWFEQRSSSERAQTPAMWTGIIAVKPKPGTHEAGIDQADVTITMLNKHTIEFPVLLITPPTPENLPQSNDRDEPREFNPLQFEPGTGGKLGPFDR